MTVENNVFTVKTKRKEHPNAVKYPGRPSIEFGNAFRTFLGDIGPTNTEDLLAGTYIFEEKVSAEFFDSLLPGDVVGMGVVKGFNEIGENKHNMPAAYKFKILDIDHTADSIKVRNVTFEDPKGKSNVKYSGTETELAFEDVSHAVGMGFAEILERDGKFFGVSEEIELKVKIVDTNAKPDEDPNAAVLNNAVSSPVEVPTSQDNTSPVESAPPTV